MLPSLEPFLIVLFQFAGVKVSVVPETLAEQFQLPAMVVPAGTVAVIVHSLILTPLLFARVILYSVIYVPQLPYSE